MMCWLSMQVNTLKKENDKIHFYQSILIRLLILINIEKKMTKSIPAKFLWRKSRKMDTIWIFVSTAPEEEIVDIDSVRQELEKIEGDIQKAKVRHNQFLQELGLKPIP